MNRIEKAQALLPQHNLDVLLIDHPIDLFYLTGQDLSLGRLLISKEDAVLYVDGRYFEGCQKTAFVSVELTQGYDAKSSFFKQWAFKGKRIGFDADITPFSTYEALGALECERCPLQSPIKKIREIKEPDEIEALARAAQLGSEGYDFVAQSLQEGITEKALALELELFWRKKGGEGLAFSPHIAFGENASQPHYHPSQRELRQGDLVLIDIGVTLGKYHSDMTRVLFFGEPSSEMKKVYSIVREAQAAALALCQPGNLIGDLDRAARSFIDKAGYGEFFTHSLGHGVGLEIHESPILRSTTPGTLQEGMVITIEPGIYLPSVGGVRLEDTIAITSDGYRNLTHRPLLTQ